MPSTGFIISTQAQRAARFIFPPNTRTELAQRALETLVPRWVENLNTRERLTLDSDITIQGPYFCPLIDEGHYGDDMWIVSGYFTSQRPREVNEDFLWNTRELQHEVGIEDEAIPRRHRVLPRSLDQQMQFVRENADKVYGDLRQGANLLQEARNAGEI